MRVGVRLKIATTLLKRGEGYVIGRHFLPQIPHELAIAVLVVEGAPCQVMPEEARGGASLRREPQGAVVVALMVVEGQAAACLPVL